MSKKDKLDARPARMDLTSRECSKLIGALLGGLAQMADVDQLRIAVRWWAETDEAWQLLRHTHELVRLTGDPHGCVEDFGGIQ